MRGDKKIDHLIEKVVGRLERIEGISAVAIGGSYARGTADEKSDLDLGLYYDPQKAFSVEALSEAAQVLDDRHQAGLVTRFGEWGPGVNGGGWLIIGGHPVDLLYRDLDKVGAAIDDCRAGRASAVYQLGHPLGFFNQIYMGEVHYCRPVHDPKGVVKLLKQLTADYPPAMSKTLMEKHMFDAEFELEIAGKPAHRDDVMYVSGCIFRSIGFMALVLYALNRRYFINEKGALLELSRRDWIKPVHFVESAGQILGNLGIRSKELLRSIDKTRDLLGSVREVCMIQQRLKKPGSGS